MKHFIRYATHAVMISFALASLGNIKTFLVDANHPVEVAWLLGIALGTSLVLISILLSETDRRSPAWLWLAATGTSLALISGSMQAAEYSKHLSGAWPVLLGFGIPLAGEILLALALAAYERSVEDRKFHTINKTIESAVAHQIEAAISDFDPAAIRKRINITVNDLANKAVAHAAQQAGAVYAETAHVTAEVAQPLTDATSVASNPPDLNTILDTGRQRAVEAQRSKTEQRHNALLDILQQEYNGVSSDVLNKTELGERLGVTRQTIARDLETLATANKITLNGHLAVI